MPRDVWDALDRRIEEERKERFRKGIRTAIFWLCFTPVLIMFWVIIARTIFNLVTVH